MVKIIPRAFASLILSVSGPILGQVSSEHIISDVSRLVELRVPDKKIARQIADLRPTYYLSEFNIEELDKKQRIPPRTLFALHVLAFQSIYLDPSPAENRPGDAYFDSASAEKLAQSIRRNMARMLDVLPRFVCNKQIKLFSNCRGGWPGNTPTVCDEEWHSREDIDPLVQKRMPDTGMVPLGAFRLVLDSSLQWKRWDFCDGQKCAVFSFSQRTAPNAHGLVFCSPIDGTVYRMIETLPSQREGTNTILTEFSPISIDNGTHWFPTRYVTMIHRANQKGWLRGVHVFSEYHKLETDSNIIFGTPK